MSPFAPLLVVLIAVALATSWILFPFAIHQVEEGHVGFYWVGGALSSSVSEPGFHLMIPFITKTSSVQITIQTDTVRNIPCGTSGGSVIYFDSIEVVNRLKKDKAWNTVKTYGVEYDKIWIFDKIHHEINQFCSSHTLQEVYIDLFEKLDEALAKALQESCDKWDTGIEIVAIRVTKPRIPELVRKNYEEIETAKTQLLVQQQKELVARKEEEIGRMRAKMHAEKEAIVATINAEKAANISKITAEMEIMQKESELRKEKIQNEIYTNHHKSLTDAEYYQISKAAEANQAKYTPEYLRYVLYTSLSSNIKIYFGESIPSIFTGLLGEKDSEKLPFP